jgi:hypothetical protein
VARKGWWHEEIQHLENQESVDAGSSCLADLSAAAGVFADWQPGIGNGEGRGGILARANVARLAKLSATDIQSNAG